MIQINIHLRLSLILFSTRLAAVVMSDHLMNEREEYCMSEHFQPRCPKNEVILMRSAIFGRMRIGRCVKAEEVTAHRTKVGDDPQYFGCSEDVLLILDQKCSGLSECDVRLSDISDKDVHPCFPGLTVYLEVSYDCKNIADEVRSYTLMATTDPIHIIGSFDSTMIICGTKSQPWIVEAPAGQRIRLSLLDFAASTEDGGRAQRKQPCSNYGVIVDKTAKRNVSICGEGGLREEELYISRGNEISIIFNSADEDEETKTIARRFLLAAASIGCSDLVPPDDAWLKRSEDTIVIGCYASRQTWHLICQEGNWIGVFGNCSHGILAPDPVEELEQMKGESWTDGQVLAMVSIGGLTIAVCLAILCAAIICLRRVSVRNKKHQEYTTINCTIGSTRRQQIDAVNPPNAPVTGFTGNGLHDLGTQQQMPTYSVYVGETGFNNVA